MGLLCRDLRLKYQEKNSRDRYLHFNKQKIVAVLHVEQSWPAYGPMQL